MRTNATHAAAAVFLVVLAMSGAFVVDVAAQRPSPVPFDDTVRTGLTGATTMQARAAGHAVPKAEVFYSQFRYAIGYYGVASLVDALGRPGHARQFGRPLAVYVTALDGAELTAEGFLTAPGGEAWVPAEAAVFVVDSRARTPGGPAVVPFADRAAARAFAERYGGEVHGWAAVRGMAFGTERTTRASFRAAREARTRWADRAVRDARALLARPVSVVVGEDAPTLAAAVAAAPPNTTVVVPPGTYAANLTVDKPVTVRGAGRQTHLRGDGNGSVVRVRAPRVAIADLRISGVGTTKSPESVPANESAWDYSVQLGYGYGDAGVVLDHANGSLVHDIAVETPTNGVLVRWSDRAVVDGVTVNGTAAWADGFMGVMDFASRIVVQDSTFRGGRDGVYTHRAHGTVVRDNRMTGMRFGVHEMYTSDALVANNTARETNTGLIVMTRPSGNLLVDDDVRDSRAGIYVAGSASYVAGNVVVANGIGLYLSSRRSLVERNRVAANDVGLRAASLVPTNRVVANDVVDNRRPALAILGPLRVWPGNFWAGAPGRDRDGDGRLDRPFHPTGPVDRRVGRVPGAATLARSPAVTAIRELQGLVPGLSGTGVVDPEPLARPAAAGPPADREGR
ncbi:MAG: NosD domain-containing protein [Halobacteriales archaeon]